MISSEVIKKAVYELCVRANTQLPVGVVKKIQAAMAIETDSVALEVLDLILMNAQMSAEVSRPLCQDSGQVLVFAKVGEQLQTQGLYESINQGVQEAYCKNFYRKSVVKNALFDRENTQNNTPAVIYTEICAGDSLELQILLKGGGAENKSQFTVLTPTADEAEIIEFVKKVAAQAGANACPPFFIGVGIGGTMDYATLLSKKALLLEDNIDKNHEDLAEKIKKQINETGIGPAGYGGQTSVLDVKILTSSTHIASMPVAVTINCHSSRHAKCIIDNENSISFPPYENLFSSNEGSVDEGHYVRVNTADVQALRCLKTGQNVLLSGEVYTARDMAHKRLVELIKNDMPLPIDLKDKIIFYAGPCPSAPGEIIGPVGPTTASRMDKYAPVIYSEGLLGTIGKGTRSEESKTAIKKYGGLYFTAVGGVACLLSRKIVKSELVAFEDLGTEAIYKLELKDFPVKLELS